MKGSIAAENLVAAQPRERHFQPRLTDPPRDDVHVDAVHRGLIERTHRLFQPRLHLFSAELEFLVLRAEALSRLPGEFPFAEVLLGEDDRKSVDVSSLAAGQRGERSGIDAAAQENPQRHIRDQVAANDIFEQRPQLFGDRAAGAFDRSRRWPRGLANIPIGFAANI